MPSRVIVNKTHHSGKRLGTPTLEHSTTSESEPECHFLELGVQRFFFKWAYKAWKIDYNIIAAMQDQLFPPSPVLITL